MRKSHLIVLAVLMTAFLVGAQETPKPMADTYSSLADTILAVKKTEANFVRSLLNGHAHGAKAYFMAGEYDKSAAEMALFANEGDNAVAGVRKRLLEGGHHHNAEGEAKGIYEPGFVIVTKKAKMAILAASAAMRTAKDGAARKAAWDAFAKAADPLTAK
ncbi:MAG: hypothetical protein ACYTEG_01815 [Planctomycetota bacterium]|jgi:hypothetical protein